MFGRYMIKTVHLRTVQAQNQTSYVVNWSGQDVFRRLYGLYNLDTKFSVTQSDDG